GASAMITGGAPTPEGAPPPPASATGSPAQSPPSAGTITLLSAKTSPRVSFFYGVRSPSLRFEIESTPAQNNLRIDIVAESGEVLRSYYRNDVEPRTPVGIRWDGMTASKQAAPRGHYSFRVSAQGTARFAHRASTSSEPLSLGFDFYLYEFPLLGPHDYGG